MENKMQDLERILAKFGEIVSSNFCDDLAKKTRFVQRSTSQIQGYEFAQSMMIPTISGRCKRISEGTPGGIAG
jgi:hypothetical protein